MVGWILSYGATALTFVVCDAIWLSLTAERLYRAKLGDLLLADFRVAPAIAFYLLYLAGILVLAILPALPSGRWTAAFLRGAMLGLVAYGTYDLTNQATVRGWSGVVTAADLCWGTVLTGTAATVGFLVLRWFAGRG